MPAFIEHEGRLVEIPVEVEAQGPEAVAAFLAKRSTPKKPAPKET